MNTFGEGTHDIFVDGNQYNLNITIVLTHTTHFVAVQKMISRKCSYTNILPESVVNFELSLHIQFNGEKV